MPDQPKSPKRESDSVATVALCAERQAATPAHEFDVVTELTENRDSYTSSNKYLALGAFPVHIRICLNRVKVRVIPEPTNSLIVACCVSNGLRVLSADEDIQTLISLARQLYAIGYVSNIYLYEQIADLLSLLTLDVIGETMHGVEDHSCHFPEQLCLDIEKLADALGMETSSIITLTVIVTLSSQPAVLPDHQDLLRQHVENFIGVVQARIQIAEALVDLLTDPTEVG